MVVKKQKANRGKIKDSAKNVKLHRLYYKKINVVTSYFVAYVTDVIVELFESQTEFINEYV